MLVKLFGILIGFLLFFLAELSFGVDHFKVSKDKPLYLGVARLDVIHHEGANGRHEFPHLQRVKASFLNSLVVDGYDVEKHLFLVPYLARTEAAPSSGQPLYAMYITVLSQQESEITSNRIDGVRMLRGTRGKIRGMPPGSNAEAIATVGEDTIENFIIGARKFGNPWLIADSRFAYLRAPSKVDPEQAIEGTRTPFFDFHFLFSEILVSSKDLYAEYFCKVGDSPINGAFIHWNQETIFGIDCPGLLTNKKVVLNELF